MQNSENNQLQAEETKPRLRDIITWPRRATEEKYPWGEWLDGSVWRLKQYEDFHVSVESMRSAIYMAAYRKGVKVKTHIPKAHDGIYVQKIK
jgi:hypothetical protein